MIVRRGRARPLRAQEPLPDDAIAGTMSGYARGWLYYTRPDGALMAIAFDPERLESNGEPKLIATGVRVEAFNGQAQTAVAADGTLAYVLGEVADIGVLAALDRNGQLDTLPFPAANSMGVDIAPDGLSLMVVIPSLSGTLELWRYDLRSNERSRLLSDLCASETRWTPDGRGVIACAAGLRQVRLDPTRPGALDTLAQIPGFPASVSSDGRTLLIQSRSADSTGGNVIWSLSLTPPSLPQRLAVGRTTRAFLPAFSPDGRRVAYLSASGGVFVEPMPPTGEVYRASGQLNGDVPAWSRDGRELFFASSSRLYAVPVQPGSPPQFGPPRLIAPVRFANMDGRPYAAFPDGRRFIVKLPSPEHSARSIRLVIGERPEQRP